MAITSGGEEQSERRRGGGRPRVAQAPAPAVPGGVRTYEELEGGEGRILTFRPRRFTAAELAPLRCRVSVEPEPDAPAKAPRRECALRDVSRSGVAFERPHDLPLTLGQPLSLAVRLDGYPVWSGRARVRALREQGGGPVVAASFGEALLDADELLQLRERWIPGAAGVRLRDRPWRGGRHRGAAEARALLGDLRLYLAELEEELAALEGALPWSVVEGRPSLARTAVVARLRSEVAEDVVRLFDEVGAALRAAPTEELPALRALSLRQLQATLMQAPWMHRARYKPLGYAGDFEVMNYLYEHDFEGPTLFARTLGYACMQTSAARAVSCRKDLVKGALREALARHGAADRPLRLLSIAAGPARELQELLLELEELPCELEVVLFDQDRRALEHAYHRLRPLADARFPGRVRIEFLNESIRRLLRDMRLFEGVPRFDAVYSAGLFDYLQEVTAVRLARNLCAAAAPGGRVMIGNMVDHPHRWLMDIHLEWELRYRTREELLEIGRRAAPGAPVRILEEASGVNPFVEVQVG